VQSQTARVPGDTRKYFAALFLSSKGSGGFIDSILNYSLEKYNKHTIGCISYIIAYTASQKQNTRDSVLA
jgi:hypothetical protein